MLVCFGIVDNGTAGGAAFSFSPYVSKGFGNTKWVMETRGYVDVGVIGTVKSELDYPLNAMYGGINLRLSSTVAALKEWSIALSVGTNFNDPSNVMKDHDWLTIPGDFDGKISYTESSAKMNSLVGSIEVQLTLKQGLKSRFGLLGGMRYQHFDQELYDLKGWQLDENLDRFYFDVYQDTLVGTYKVTYTMPNVGLFYRLQFTPGSSAEVNGAFSVPFVSDEDDHVLRNRIATASSTGTGFFGKIKFHLAPPSVGIGVKPFVELEGEFLTIDAQPKQEIYWYGDDPITPAEDDTGSRVTGIPHHVTSKQGYITGRIGLSF